ncbi:MAG: alpha/beta fold hydrolase [Myxococcota bacterium]
MAIDLSGVRAPEAIAQPSSDAPSPAQQLSVPLDPRPTVPSARNGLEPTRPSGVFTGARPIEIVDLEPRAEDPNSTLTVWIMGYGATRPQTESYVEGWELDSRFPGRDAYYTWEDEDAIEQELRDHHARYGDDARIIVVGQSWGGKAALNVLREVPEIPVESLITVDPVSRFEDGARPSNVENWVNTHRPLDGWDTLSRTWVLAPVVAVANFFLSLFGRLLPGDGLATLGGQLGALPEADSNVEVYDTGHANVAEQLFVVLEDYDLIRRQNAQRRLEAQRQATA